MIVPGKTYPNPYDFGMWRTAPGCLVSDEWQDILQTANQKKSKRTAPFHRSMTDEAWMVCLERAGLVDDAMAKKVLNALERIKETGSGWGGEVSLIPELGGDEDSGSIVNLGRTLQEPMARMATRDEILDFADHVLKLEQTLLDMIAEHAETLMPGHTHFSQANPITLGSFLLGVFDELNRGLSLLEHAYRDTNRNTGGCGATSGTAWPVDRQLLTELLGFEEVSEPAYEGEASQDHTLTTHYSMSNICMLISKAATNFEIWGIDEIGMVDLDPSWHGVSSCMPQKSHAGSVYEWMRVMTARVIGKMSEAVSLYKGEFHGDVMSMLSMCNGFNTFDATGCVRMFEGAMRNLVVHKDRMLQYVRDGYSCATELAVLLIAEKGYGGRRAHRIVATMVRHAKEQGLKPYECTGEMLDAAALEVEDKPPKVTTAELVKALDPEEFLKTHIHIGGVAPQETMRLHEKRVKVVAENLKRQQERRDAVEKGYAYLSSEVKRILDK